MLEKITAALLIAALLATSYAIDFRQFMVIRQVAGVEYEIFLAVWAAIAGFYAVTGRAHYLYWLVSAALLGHVFFWGFVELYFLAVSPTRTIGGSVTLLVVNAIFLIRREPLLDLVKFNVIVAAVVLPLALQQTEILTAPLPSGLTLDNH